MALTDTQLADLMNPQAEDAPAAPRPVLASAGQPDAVDLSAFRTRRLAFATVLVTQPELSIPEAGQLVGFRPSTSYNIHASDDFQALVRQEAARLHNNVLTTHAERLAGLFDLTMDKTIERVAGEKASEKFLTEARQDALKALGYGQPNATVEVNNTIVVSDNTLRAAREQARSLYQGSAERKQHSDEFTAPVRTLTARPATIGSPSGAVQYEDGEMGTTDPAAGPDEPG